MKKIFIMSLVILLYCSVMSAEQDVFHTLSVKGNKIVDENGEQIVLRGLTPIEISFIEGYKMYNEVSFEEMANWGSSVVRIVVHPMTWMSRMNKKEALQKIEQLITWAAKYGMYSIIDWHAIGFNPRQVFENDQYSHKDQHIKDFWKQIAMIYKDDKRVAFYELYNEPSLQKGSATKVNEWLELKNWYEDIIDHVRKFDPDKPLIVTGFDWGYDLSFAGEHPIERDNLIYSVHPYPMKRQPWDTYFGYLSETYPMLVTEFSFDNSTMTMFNEQSYNQGGGEGDYSDNLITYLEDKKIGWICWNFSAAWNLQLIKNLEFEPTDTGAFIKTKLLEYGGTPVLKKDHEDYIHHKILNYQSPSSKKQGSNLALNKPAFALSRELESLDAVNVTDGNLKTRWASEHMEDPTWIVIDLQEKQAVKKVVIHWETACSEEYKIQISDDNENWKDVYYTDKGKGGTETIRFMKKTTRYLRIYGIYRATEWGTSIYEVEVY